MANTENDLAGAQREHWQGTYAAHPGMYGEQPSAPAVHAAEMFRAVSAREVLELGADHGRDALYFAREGFTVQATDFSPVGLEQLRLERTPTARGSLAASGARCSTTS